MRQVIGISLGNNTSAALVDPIFGVKLAISEERLNGEKNTKQFPIKAIKACVDQVRPHTDEYIFAISSYEVINDRTLKYMPKLEEAYPNATEEERVIADMAMAKCSNFYEMMEMYLRVVCELDQYDKVSILRIPHHEAHRLPAYYLSGFGEDSDTIPITVTADGFGDGLSATIFNHKTGEMLATETIETSIGLVYQYVTGALGFKEHQHEGKITGLAAFGKSIYSMRFLDEIIGFDRTMNEFVPRYKNKIKRTALTKDIPMNRNITGFKSMLFLKESVYNLVRTLKADGATDADIAASVQSYAEFMITNWIGAILSDNGLFGDKRVKIALSGGLFANVKINYQVYKTIEPSELFVLPPMGDEGTSIGAALGAIIRIHGEKFIDKKVFSKDCLYFGGVEQNEEDKKFHIDPERHDIFNVNEWGNERALSKQIAELLANEKIVCVSRGGSEFGPRALGNHSILYDAGLKETNDSLNKRLNRTEFMPFAPITIDLFTPSLFGNVKGLEKTLKYMTIAVPVEKEFEDNYKAAYHIDKTARPQIVGIRDNFFIYNVINNYHELSGKKVLINTSFNLHNSPIIFSDKVAYESFCTADLDVLLLDDVIIVKKGLIG